jgi:hypothetical protein
MLEVVATMPSRPFAATAVAIRKSPSPSMRRSYFFDAQRRA